ncbi:Hpt domain-containing protein [Flavobacterium sp. CYK-55]|uniref:Hpt domain-containing protein n=1 Tax=Flavobacterium sp. CYK-55 TaxID=2835529 RepID=UPI001BD13C4F|nr:Hpt domain-containing protein [Flavobacterium sp. CYK-55]MBS7787188.1 Hpt domain-containing protein [Flavobacterium sp. CYK-55]
MKEVPNLSYIDQLAHENPLLRERLIGIIKDEFPTEVQKYKLENHQSDYFLMSESVHKLKHKFALLGLEKGYHLAADFEDELRAGSKNLQSDFEDVLKVIELFLSKI